MSENAKCNERDKPDDWGLATLDFCGILYEMFQVERINEHDK